MLTVDEVPQETYKGYIIKFIGDWLVFPVRTPHQVVCREHTREDCIAWIDRQEKDRIAMELSVFQDDLSSPYLCLLDTWQGPDMVDFLEQDCKPKLQPQNYPATVRRLSIKKA